MNETSETTVRNFFYNAATTYGFIHAEKELTVEGLRMDTFAIDANHNPCIIEFKKNKNRHIVGQAAQYIAIVPSYQEEISRKIKFSQINWKNLTIILVAPSYYERDLTAENYAPLQNKVHFYTYKIVPTSREKIFGLQLRYLGPAAIGPLKLSEAMVDTSDLIDLYKYFAKLDTRESKREYYTNNVLPVLQSVKTKVEHFFSRQNLYFHTSYFGNNPPYYMVRVGTDKKRTHRASIYLGFYRHGIEHGFDLTHSLEEGKLLSSLFQHEEIRTEVVHEILRRSEYHLYIPKTGFTFAMPIDGLKPEALQCVLERYSPTMPRECYFSILQPYEKESLSVDNASEILIKDYKEFKFMFDLLRNRERILAK